MTAPDHQLHFVPVIDLQWTQSSGCGWLSCGASLAAAYCVSAAWLQGLQVVTRSQLQRLGQVQPLGQPPGQPLGWRRQSR
jgi:hypothetical protein